MRLKGEYQENFKALTKTNCFAHSKYKKKLMEATGKESMEETEKNSFFPIPSYYTPSLFHKFVPSFFHPIPFQVLSQFFQTYKFLTSSFPLLSWLLS